MDGRTVKAWIEAECALKIAKEHELKLRNQICEHILGSSNKGSKKGNIGAYILTATAKINTSIDKDALKAIWNDLKQEEKKCIKFDPKIVAKEYKTIDEKSILHQVITSKPGTPSLELKGAKDGN